MSKWDKKLGVKDTAYELPPSFSQRYDYSYGAIELAIQTYAIEQKAPPHTAIVCDCIYTMWYRKSSSEQESKIVEITAREISQRTTTELSAVLRCIKWLLDHNWIKNVGTTRKRAYKLDEWKYHNIMFTHYSAISDNKGKKTRKKR